jgi:hypothetical protein
MVGTAYPSENAETYIIGPTAVKVAQQASSIFGHGSLSESLAASRLSVKMRNAPLKSIGRL